LRLVSTAQKRIDALGVGRLGSLSVYDWISARRCERALLALEQVRSEPMVSSDALAQIRRELQEAAAEHRARYRSLPFTERVRDRLRGIGR
jgi:hypothetical protein